MKRINMVLCVLALLLVVTVSIDGAWAYFTTYAVAEGGLMPELGNTVKIYEKFALEVKGNFYFNNRDLLVILRGGVCPSLGRIYRFGRGSISNCQNRIQRMKRFYQPWGHGKRQPLFLKNKNLFLFRPIMPKG